MTRSLLIVLLGCGGTQPAGPAPIDNKATPTAEAPASTECRPKGIVIDKAIGEPAIGATLVFSGSANEQVAISDEKGAFSLEVDREHDRLTLYYNDRSFEHRFEPSYCATRIRITLDPPNVPVTPIVPY